MFGVSRQGIELKVSPKAKNWQTLREAFRLTNTSTFTVEARCHLELGDPDTAIVTRVEVKGGLFGTNQGDLKREVNKRLPEVLEVMESMVETNRRFESYQTEVHAIAQFGISFHDWLQLAPTEKKPDGAELMYIIPPKPI